MNEQAPTLRFREVGKARELTRALAQTVQACGRPVAVMHVCGTHEQSIARFGLRAVFPPELDVIMGPGCPVCVTDVPEVDEAVALAEQGIRVLTYGDMLRVPGTLRSLADARARGGNVGVVYSIAEAVDAANNEADGNEIVFFASGFETTAVTTAAAVLAGLPSNLSILSAHKYIPPVMEIVAEMPGARIEGFLAAGHAAAITGWGVFERFAHRHGMPVVIAGFEPLDILAGLTQLVRLVGQGRAEVHNAYPRCVSKHGNRPAQDALWRVFQTTGGRWRGIAHVPNGNLRLRREWANVDARCRFTIDTDPLESEAPPALAALCRCGDIMAGIAGPDDCALFGQQCTPPSPVGACMVSTEGTCRIWHQYGGHRDLGGPP